MLQRKLPPNNTNPSPAAVKKRLLHINAKPLKRLGQNFLIDTGVLETIITAADLTPDDTVVEVGPGLGILTSELVKKAGNVIAVEVDKNLAAALAEALLPAHNLTVINDNILNLDPAELIRGHAVTEGNYRVVANLPYHIASPIMRHFLETSLKPAIMVIMVQKEVAQSIVAEPGDMSLLSIGVQIYGKPVIIDSVPPQSFYPPPKVESAIVRIDVYPEPKIEITNITRFFEIVRAGFSTRRKQLRNSLSAGLQLPPTETAELLNKAGISPQRRPQTLSIEEWAKVCQTFNRGNS